MVQTKKLLWYVRIKTLHSLLAPTMEIIMDKIENNGDSNK